MVARAIVSKRYPQRRPPHGFDFRIGVFVCFPLFIVIKLPIDKQAFPNLPLLRHALQAQPFFAIKHITSFIGLSVKHTVQSLKIIGQLRLYQLLQLGKIGFACARIEHLACFRVVLQHVANGGL